MVRFLLAAALATFIGSTSASAAVSLIFSTSETDAFAGNQLSLIPGDTGSMYIWASTDADTTITGFALNIDSSEPSILQATGHTINNPIVFGTFRRWNTPLGAGQLDDLVQNSNAVAITQIGLNTGDLGTYALHSRVDFSVTGVGVTNLSFSEGAGVFVGSNNTRWSDVTGGSAIVTAVPEPGSFAALGLAGLGLAGYRRIRRKA